MHVAATRLRGVSTLCALSLLEAACAGGSKAGSAHAAAVQLPRIALTTRPRAKAEYEVLPTPLVFGGGFLNKTWSFDTLVRMADNGSIEPGLAQRWRADDGGREWTLELRPNLRFHSGAPCDAAAVREHMLRWIGGREDAFIASSSRIESVDVVGPLSVRFRLSEPHYLLADLALINPMSIVGPAARREEVVPCLDGTGPWCVAAYEPMRSFRFTRNDRLPSEPGDCRVFDYRLFVASTSRDATALWALERGQVDAVVEDWMPAIPRERALELGARAEFDVDVWRGSAVVFVQFNLQRGPFTSIDLRQRLASSVDRGALIREAEAGLGDAVGGLFAPWIDNWPQPRGPTDQVRPPSESVRASLMVIDSDPSALRLAFELSRQAALVDVQLSLDLVNAAEHARRLWSGEFDACFARTWGVPYDPQATLFARFGPDPPHQTAVEFPTIRRTPELIRLVLDYQRAIEPSERAERARRVQRFIEEDVTVLPLYAPRRVAVRRQNVSGIAPGSHGYELDVRRLKVTR